MNWAGRRPGSAPLMADNPTHAHGPARDPIRGRLGHGAEFIAVPHAMHVTGVSDHMWNMLPDRTKREKAPGKAVASQSLMYMRAGRRSQSQFARDTRLYHVCRFARMSPRVFGANDCAVGYAGWISYSHRTDKLTRDRIPAFQDRLVAGRARKEWLLDRSAGPYRKPAADRTQLVRVGFPTCDVGER